MSLGYTSVSAIDDVETQFLSIRSDWAIANGFGFQGNVGYRDTGDQLASNSVGAHGYYEWPSGLRFGAFAQYEELNAAGAGSLGSFRTLGVEAMIPLTPEAQLEIFVGDTDISGFPLPITGSFGYGIEVSYNFSPSLRGRVRYDQDDLEAGTDSASFTEMGLGVDYFLNGSGTGVPVILSVEAVRGKSPFVGESSDAFSLKVTLPIGGAPGTAGRKLFGDRNVGETFVTYGG